MERGPTTKFDLVGKGLIRPIIKEGQIELLG